ncbi:MAG: trimeric intracellular cation channel family protein [Acetobacteraceae bacterium]
MGTGQPLALLLRSFDLAGTLAFAISGGLAGVARRLDLFGVVVLAIVTAISGGILRDVLIGALPPESIASWQPMALAALAGLVAFRFAHLAERLRHPVEFFDAAGLGVFAAAGTEKALAWGISWPMAAVLGMVSGIGGGMVRDILSARVPAVLQADIYALAALAGGLVVVAGRALALPPVPVAACGAAICLFLRLMALYRHWRLPTARPPGAPH